MDMSFRTGSAVVFPGMGPSRFTDVAKFMLLNPIARDLVGAADEVLGYSLVDRYRETQGDYSEFAQVAFLVNCLALARWAEGELGMAARFCVGPSFGGKAAAVHSGALPFEQAVWMTARWARCLEDHVARDHRDVITQSFARVPEDRLDEVLAELAERGEWYDISCRIDDDFHMVSLRESALDWLAKRLRSIGGLPLYTMRPPMHSSVLGALRDQVEREIFDELQFADPRIPVVADQDGAVLHSGDGVRRMLLDGFVHPVQWPRVVAALRDLGVGTLYVSGPDSLFGRVGCTTRNFQVVAVSPSTAMQPRRHRAPRPSRGGDPLPQAAP
ncbi:hypothetical protein GCM10027073_63410 [Streptomyces chlorus]|uniref:[acyl-carrier-protein] S-malonyltransferase n=1 Tax=Streptomyces chlorus TaxID=887452 RepID=A0ABW1E828_9ACTN